MSISVSNNLCFPVKNRDPVTGNNTEIVCRVATFQMIAHTKPRLFDAENPYRQAIKPKARSSDVDRSRQGISAANDLFPRNMHGKVWSTLQIYFFLIQLIYFCLFVQQDSLSWMGSSEYRRLYREGNSV